MTLDVRDLRVEFPTRRGTLTALDGISFSIAPGEVLGVVGESGAGKSITGLAIIGLLEPPGRIAGGEVRLEGKRIENLPQDELRAWADALLRATAQTKVIAFGMQTSHMRACTGLLSAVLLAEFLRNVGHNTLPGGRPGAGLEARCGSISGRRFSPEPAA